MGTYQLINMDLTLIPSSDDLRHPDGNTVHVRIFPGTLRTKPTREWPKHSPYRCWSCTLFFDTMPMLVPKSRSMQKVYEVYGNFCSLGCAVRYLMDSRTPQSGIQISWLLHLAREYLGIRFPQGRAPVAPSRLELQEFGGDLTRSEFKAQRDVPDLVTSVELPPFTTATIGVRELYYGPNEGGRGEDGVHEHLRTYDLDDMGRVSQNLANRTHRAQEGLFEQYVRENEQGNQ